MRKARVTTRVLFVFVARNESPLSENTSLECIPKAGMFLFSSDSLNYTQARSFCQERNASLAHVISEVRTDGLGRYVSPSIPSFVGLSNSDGERIWKNEYGTRGYFSSPFSADFDVFARRACNNYLNNSLSGES